MSSASIPVVSRRIILASLFALATAGVTAAQVVPCRATEVISVSNSNAPAWHTARGAAISADGRFVAFHSASGGLESYTAFLDDNQMEDVYIHDREHLLITRVSVGFTVHE